MEQRFVVSDSHGINDRPRGAIVQTISATTVRRRVREMRRWAAGTYDTFTDARHGDGTRVVTARHYVRGVENVRTLRIEAAR